MTPFNPPTLASRPDYLDFHEYWNILPSELPPEGGTIFRNSTEPLEILQDSEGADEAIAKFLRNHFEKIHYNLYDCWGREKLPLMAELVEAGEGCIYYRGQANGSFSPEDRTLEIPMGDADMFSKELFEGMSLVLRSHHPLWRIAICRSRDLTCMVYPDCIRFRDQICDPSASDGIIREWAAILEESNVESTRLCQKMNSLMDRILPNWPTPENPVRMLDTSIEGHRREVWIAYYESGFYYLSSPTGSRRRVYINKQLQRFSIRPEPGIS